MDAKQVVIHKETIKVASVYPPISTRQFDWCAWVDDYEEYGRSNPLVARVSFGWGPTKEEAIQDLGLDPSIIPEFRELGLRNSAHEQLGRLRATLRECGMLGVC
jgi:hypothetical protein